MDAARSFSGAFPSLGFSVFSEFGIFCYHNRREPPCKSGAGCQSIELKPANIIKKLGLKPLEKEGGFYRQTYVSPETIASSHLPDRYGGHRSFSSAIYYFLQKDEVSVMHRLLSDEVYHFYAGDPVQLLTLKPGGPGLVFLGNDIMFGQHPQVVVPAGVWQGMKIVDGGEYALMGTTVSPAYAEDDFELGDPEKLSEQFPGHSELIKTLSR